MLAISRERRRCRQITAQSRLTMLQPKQNVLIVERLIRCWYQMAVQKKHYSGVGFFKEEQTDSREGDP